MPKPILNRTEKMWIKYKARKGVNYIKKHKGSALAGTGIVAGSAIGGYKIIQDDNKPTSKTASAAYPTADAIRETLRVAYRNPKWPRAAVGGSLLGLASGAGGYYAGRAAQGESKDESWATKHPWLNWLGWGVIQSQTLPFTPISSVALGYGLGKRKRMEENNEMGKTASMNSPSKAAMIGLSMMVNR
jgi:hypothetical protein